ncbi:NTP transferase domain-containing protein [Candidatus Pacearchaeota archaeon]|nr:NTP transferase domain-containing protein [Candidatus Pacearchaeota archaeon]
MNYKVCILAAGVGSRMGDFTKYLNKVLIPIKGKPAICHIIEKFPESIEIVIATGFKQDPLISYVKTAYPNRKITFIKVDPFQGEGSGPGHSLLSCKDSLQCPFVHVAGDTLISEEIPEPVENWIGAAKVSDTSRFCSLKIEGDVVKELQDKVESDNEHAYIGLIGVADYASFWNSLENSEEEIDGEIQVSRGIGSLIDIGLIPKEFTWFDTGTPKSYEYARINYPDGEGYSGD